MNSFVAFVWLLAVLEIEAVALCMPRKHANTSISCKGGYLPSPLNSKEPSFACTKNLFYVCLKYLLEIKLIMYESSPTAWDVTVAGFYVVLSYK